MNFILSLLLAGSVTACNAEQSNSTTQQEPVVAQANAQKGLENNGQVVITGNIANAAGKQVFLQTLPQQTPGMGNPQITLIDTSIVQADGSFVLEGNIDQEHIALLGFDNKHMAYLLLNGGNHTFHADFNNFNNYNFTNSKGTAILKEYLGTVSNNFNQINALEMQIRQAGNSPQAEQLREQQHQLYEISFDYIKNFIDTTSSNVAALFAADMLDLNTEHDYLKDVRDRMAKEAGSSKYFTHLNLKLQDHESILGTKAPEIRIPDPDGDTISLSSLQGKVVLIDFWAAWCGPCRRENPNVVRLYDEFKDKGFTVYSVSLDKDRSKWLAAIEQDNLKWDNHVSELRGWQTEASKPYGVNSIPATFLLNEKGEIIAKNLRGYFLEKKVAQLLDK